ncbi:MAG: hypothetical protein K8U57_22135 [Planctomycetes bacterium]|nr:hypothetical protein [Planctomycetota bacterium]
MKQFRVWGVSAALAVGLGGPVAAADMPEQTTLMKKLFGPKTAKPAGPSAASDPQRPVTITAPLPQEVLIDALRAERDAWQRRVSVCEELRRIAFDKGDDALSRQADELERQATALYNLRVAGLGVTRVKAPLPESAGFASEALSSDSQTAAAKARKLAAPPTPVSGTTTAQVREVKP